MDAFVYIRISTGSIGSVLAELVTKPGAKRAVVTVGDWDVLMHVTGPDLGSIAQMMVSEVHGVPGVVRTATAPVIPAERLGLLGELGATLPPIVADACYVHVRVRTGSALDVYESLREIPEVAGVAILGGTWDLVACLPLQWEIASGVILEQIHGIDGVVATSTLVSIAYEEPEEDRDQFSAWS